MSAADGRRGDALVVRVLAVGVICAAFASIVWYVVDAAIAH